MLNLNHCRAPEKIAWYKHERIEPTSAGNATVIFRDIDEYLKKLINEADAVVGCIAWLTHDRLLRALQEKPCQFVVQKEDFLRPDARGNRATLRMLYRKLGEWSKISQWDLPSELARRLNDCQAELQTIRCVGVAMKGAKQVRPLMHHKFAIFCRKPEKTKVECSCDCGDPDNPKLIRPGRLECIQSRMADKPVIGFESVWRQLMPEQKDHLWSQLGGSFCCNCQCHHTKPQPLIPYAVATGSYNWTHNALNSLENLIVLTDPVIVKSYADEYGRVLALSEPLDWTSQWVEPEWRIGT